MSEDVMSHRTVTVEVAGMHCASCGILVDDCLEDVDGVVSSQTSVKSGQCVAVVTESVTDADVLAAVVEAGYTGTVLATVATS
jgi:copper chaperone CopZ